MPFLVYGACQIALARPITLPCTCMYSCPSAFYCWCINFFYSTGEESCQPTKISKQITILIFLNMKTGPQSLTHTVDHFFVRRLCLCDDDDGRKHYFFVKDNKRKREMCFRNKIRKVTKTELLQNKILWSFILLKNIVNIKKLY
jgi:hypothetical protein